MLIEEVTINDLDQIQLLQPEGWTSIDKEFDFYVKSPFCYPVKVIIDNKIVGIGASIVFERSAWLAHIIVDVNCRNQRIGFTIVDELVKRAAKIKPIETFMLIATELGRPVYLKHGFKDVCDYLFMKRELPWVEKPISENIHDFEEKHRAAVYDIDFSTTGEKRESLLEPYISSSKVYIENGKVTGYFMPALREGLIYAKSRNAGLELMKLKYSDSAKAVIPYENTVGIDFLKENGFVEISTKGTRMVLGKPLNWKPKCIYSRISGNFG